MDLRKAAFVVSCVGITLAGCGGGEQGRWLEQRRRQVERTLAEKSEIAQSLNERRRELDVLEEKLAGLQLRELHAGDFSRILSDHDLDSLAIDEVEGALRVRFGASGGASRLFAALRAFPEAERDLVLKRVSVEPTAWSAELEVPVGPVTTVPRGPLTPGAPAPATPMPGPGVLEAVFDRNQLSRQLEELQRMEQHISALDKVLGEVSQLGQRKAELEARLRAAEGLNPAERLVGQRALVEALFGGPRPRLPTGVAGFQAHRVTLSGWGQGDPARRLAALAEVGQVVEAGPEVIVLSTAARP